MLVLLLLSSLANHVVYMLVETGHARFAKMPQPESKSDAMGARICGPDQRYPFQQLQEDGSSACSSPVRGHSIQGFPTTPSSAASFQPSPSGSQQCASLQPEI